MKTILMVIMIAGIYLLTGCGSNTSTKNEREIDSAGINKSAENANTAGNTENTNQNPDDTNNTVKISPADSGAKSDNSVNTISVASLRAPMDTVLRKISTTKMTGDFDIDYAIAMIDHHQGAVAMSDYEVNNGKDEKVKDIAKRMMKSENEEITKLKAFLKSYRLSGLKQGQGVITKSATDMMDKLNAKSLAGDTDRDYAALMIEHHQFGLDMGDKLQTQGVSADLKKMAKDQKAALTKDIRDLKAVAQMK
jgi:uncharacterized protein (DUF305 family)